MRIGVPKEVKDKEYRVGLTPAFAKVLIENGHQVVVQRQAGAMIGYHDHHYEEAGCVLVDTPSEVYQCEMIIKVKEPQPSEYTYLFEGQILYTYLHLAPDLKQTEALLKKKVVGIAYETVTDEDGRLPLLTPMSEIAGRVAIQAGAQALQLSYGGKGVLLGGVPGVKNGKVTVIGGGIVGTEAARMAMGLGADVTIIDRSLKRLRELDALFGPRLKTLFSTPANVEECVAESDLVIGAVLIPGKTAPKLVTADMIRKMQPGSVFVDVAIDQGGCSETSRPTSHSEPTYVVDGVVHYCVTNMPGAVAKTSTQALTNATFPFALEIANRGWKAAMKRDRHLKNGLNVCLGKVTNSAVANDLGFEYVSPESFF
jgi:alanine dehydrogenase